MSTHNLDIRYVEEERLLSPALGAIRQEHGRLNARPLLRVRLGTRSPDVLLRHGDGLLTIELKLDDWARAIGQAALNQLWVELSYIAIPLSSSSEKAVSEAKRHGIGVIAVSG